MAQHARAGEHVSQEGPIVALDAISTAIAGKPWLRADQFHGAP
jgi:hypothetical protein